MNTDLILWRHAEAEDLEENDDVGGSDLSRRLTHKGERQASRMAAWLDRQLPDGVRVYTSPAVRTEQTVIALGRKYRIREELRPEGSVEELLTVADWPLAKHASLIVGHQPTLGRVVAQLVGLRESECSIRKGSVWWLRQRERLGKTQTVILTVQTPELL